MKLVVLADAPGTPLEHALVRRTLAWAEQVAPDGWITADSLPADLRGPLLVVTAGVPRLSAAHAAVARLDLDEGVDVDFGPTFAGGLYLVAMREPRPELLPPRWDEPGAFAGAIRLGHEAGLEMGWLRMERTVGTAADRAALRADPLVEPGIRALL